MKWFVFALKMVDVSTTAHVLPLHATEQNLVCYNWLGPIYIQSSAVRGKPRQACAILIFISKFSGDYVALFFRVFIFSFGIFCRKPSGGLNTRGCSNAFAAFVMFIRKIALSFDLSECLHVGMSALSFSLFFLDFISSVGVLNE